MSGAVNIVFANIEGTPDYTFVETEYDDGRGLGIGKWVDCPNGLVAIRITQADFEAALARELVNA
ncbi:hypothetical protein [Frigoribacterium sp. UYMn621]|uniref:hypothetical protein n=1 Tax=Frigoribacterium sp. UYMn621 TaxID=3156343 RepID=UPI0033973FBF